MWGTVFICELVTVANWAVTLKRVFYWVLFVFLLFIPMALSFFLVYDFLPFAQSLFLFWRSRPGTLLLSDVLFLEGGVILVFGALIGGVTLYDAWAQLDVRKVQFTESIWNWKIIAKERNYPTGLMVGIALLAAGIIYIVVAVLVPAGIIPSL